MLDSQSLRQRAAFIQTIRQFFVHHSYIEVDTPTRLPALVPEAHIETQKAGEWYLQTSPELCMKRILAAGIPKLFQICKCFRKNERGPLHHPEFTMLEWYRTESDYLDLMTECEELLLFLVDHLEIEPVIHVVDHNISLEMPWERLTVHEAFRRYSPISVEEALAVDRFDETLCRYVEPHLGFSRPVFVLDYPAELGSLARLKERDPSVAERFELYIGGIEIANGFSELTDGDEQRDRFFVEIESMKIQNRSPGPLPEKFLQALDDMKPAAGIALGVDRLLMLFTGKKSIDEVVPFVCEEL